MTDYCPKCRSRLYPDDYKDVSLYGCCHYCTPNLEQRKNYKNNKVNKGDETK